MSTKHPKRGLTLKRRQGESLVVSLEPGGPPLIEIVVQRIDRREARVRIIAPRELTILRRELHDALRAGSREAVTCD